jgi:hypothetical protein
MDVGATRDRSRGQLYRTKVGDADELGLQADTDADIG